jgi:hypothetical protein
MREVSVRKTFVVGLFAMAICVLPSVAWAQEQLDCAPTYEGQKVEPGASVQLENGSWVTVTDANACMGESLAHAAESAQAQGSATATSGSASTSASSATGAAATSSGGAVPQGAAATGLGGMSDEVTGLLVAALVLGGMIAAGLGAFVGRRTTT